MEILPGGPLVGDPALPGDKSISHRYAILGALAEGETIIHNYSASQDCQSTLGCLHELGIAIDRRGSRTSITGAGFAGFKEPAGQLDAGNSGTTMRLLSGVLASLPFTTEMAGDESLNRRPMRRIIEPLSRMGALVAARDGEFPPLRIQGGQLKAIDYTLPVASAQVKSCILLAGLHAEGTTTVREKTASRDHTERALPEFGARLQRDRNAIHLTGGQRLLGREVGVPGDFSAAAFLIVASLLVPGSKLTLRNLGLNPTRTGLLQLLDPESKAIQVTSSHSWGGEPVGTLEVGYRPDLLKNFPSRLGASWIPNVIDEIPVLAVLGTQLPHGFAVQDATELRKKESDRISAITGNLRRLGVRVDEHEDGFFIPPGQVIRGGLVKTHGDHRIAMAFAIAGLISRDGVTLDDPDCSQISFPDFFGVLENLRS